MIRLADLPEHPRYGVELYCPVCTNAYSATRGDYFWMPPTKIFRCQACRTPLRLIIKNETHKRITTADAEEPQPATEAKP